MQRLSKKVRTRKNLAMALIAFGLAGIGVSAVLSAREPTEPRPSRIKSPLVSSGPSRTKLQPKAIASYRVPPTDPKYIAIPAINISNTPVLNLGLLASGAIATPNNIYETGWYRGSSKPGQAGAMFIYGHVSTWTARGIFYNLKHLAPGSKITITRGDNTRYTYEVVSTKIYPYDRVNMQQVLSPIDPHLPGLNLMTCAGQVIRGTSEFSERLVVFARLKS